MSLEFTIYDLRFTIDAPWSAVAERSGDTALLREAVAEEAEPEKLPVPRTDGFTRCDQVTLPKSGVALRFPPQSMTRLGVRWQSAAATPL